MFINKCFYILINFLNFQYEKLIILELKKINNITITINILFFNKFQTKIIKNNKHKHF
jgi:hypothetical protein